nr:hypothetical protein T22B7.3 - Caenorhabditis elegans [Caenorhabditis elegans]
MASSTLVRTLEHHVKRILMVRPTHFELKYSINPWMDMKRGVNREKALKQWDQLKNTIENSGAKVEVMESTGAESLPDIVFAANAAIIKGNKAYLASFAHPERQGERYFYEQWFTNNGYECVGDQDIPSEGESKRMVCWSG